MFVALNQVCDQVQNQNLLWDRIWYASSLGLVRIDRTASEIVTGTARGVRAQVMSQLNQVWYQVWEQVLSLLNQVRDPE
jgi:hypothetical protein